MRAVVQRVAEADVTVEGAVTGAIETGLAVLLGVDVDDTSADADHLAEKICHLRIFEDGAGKMNRSVIEAGGSILAVSQFTLLGDCRKGRRPSFIRAARPEDASALFDEFTAACRDRGVTVAEGVFQAEMMVRIHNDGPVTILLDSKKEF